MMCFQPLLNTGTGGAFETVYSCTYDSAGNLYSVTDYINNEVTMYLHDAEGKLVYSYVYDRETYLNLYGTQVYYDEQSRISFVTHSLDYVYPSGVVDSNMNYSYYYNYDHNGAIGNLHIYGDNISGSLKPVYDNFGRLSTRTINFSVGNSSAFYNKLTYDYVTKIIISLHGCRRLRVRSAKAQAQALFLQQHGIIPTIKTEISHR